MSIKYSKNDLRLMHQAVQDNTSMDELARKIGRGKTPEGLIRKLTNLVRVNPRIWNSKKILIYISKYTPSKIDFAQNVEKPVKKEKRTSQLTKNIKKRRLISLGYDLANVINDEDAIIAEVVPDDALVPECVERDFRTHSQRFLEHIYRESIYNHLDITYNGGFVKIRFTSPFNYKGKKEFLEKYAELLREESVKPK